MTTQEKIEVMKAYAEGKTIQLRTLGSEKWMDWDDDQEPNWNWETTEYRIRPTDKYRPYKNTDEMIEDYKRRARIVTYDFCRPSIWIKSCDEFVSLITEFGIDCVWRSVCQDGISMKGLFDCFTYLDGSPCGRKEAD